MEEVAHKDRIDAILSFWFGEGVDRDLVPGPEFKKLWFGFSAEVDV